MTNPVNLFFRITNRLFAFFMDFLGRLLRNSRRFDPANTFRKRLLVARQGGLGDLLFVSAAIAELKRQHPYLQIDLMCHPQYHGALSRTEAISNLLDHRWPSITRLPGYDYFIFLDGVVECDPEARTTNIYDLLAGKYFDITLPADAKLPSVRPDVHAVTEIASRVRGFAEAKIKIGLQPYANSPVRTPSAQFWVRTGVACLNRLPDAALFIVAERGRADDANALAQAINDGIGGVRAVSAAGATDDTSELTTLVSMLDAVIAPDSSLIHLAAAFCLPAVGIYGPFPSALRTLYYPETHSIDAPAACAPCFTHGHWPCREAKKAGLISSPCFDRISQATIVEAIETLATGIHVRQSGKRLRDYAELRPTSRSETSKFRNRILRILALALGTDPHALNGAEIGSGGDPLMQSVISVDLPIPYTKCGMAPVQLKGDGRHLGWFADDSLDFVYSSHLFEDFGPDENSAVLAEWLRALRPGGVLALLLPEQTRYLRACERKGEAPNEHHVIGNFGPEYIVGLVATRRGCDLLCTTRFWKDDEDEYNFLVIIQKCSASPKVPE